MLIYRNRRLYLFFIIATIGLGLTSRSSFSPDLIKNYAGDPLYALMIFLIIGFLLPQASSIKVALICILVCYTIELSQLYQADWINEIRRTRLGGLVLGFGFLWSDLVSYFIGTVVGVGLDRIINKY